MVIAQYTRGIVWKNLSFLAYERKKTEADVTCQSVDTHMKSPSEWLLGRALQGTSHRTLYGIRVM